VCGRRHWCQLCYALLRQYLSLAVSLQHEKFQSAPGSRVGTPAYLAPEVIMTTKGQTYDGKVGHVLCFIDDIVATTSNC